MPSNHLILCSSLLLLPSIFPSIRVFSSELTVHIRWSKYWSFSFYISPSNDYSGLISFRSDCFDLHAVQGPHKSLLQDHNSKKSILLCSAFFLVQLSYPYKTTGKTIALTRWTFVSKVMTLLCHMLSSFVIVFLSKSKCLLISWLQSMSMTFCDAQENKICRYFHFFPVCYEVMGPDAVILVFWMLSFKPAFSISSYTFITRLFSSFSLLDIRKISSAYLMLLIFLLAILIPAWDSFCLAFRMMYSAYKLNKQGDNIQP